MTTLCSLHNRRMVFKPLLLTLLFVLPHLAAKAECRRDTIYTFNYSNGSTTKVKLNRSINSFDVNNKLVKTLQQTWQNNTAYVNDLSIEYTLDVFGNTIAELRKQWDAVNSIWKNTSSVVFTFNANKKLTERIDQTWNTTLAAWQNSGQEIYTYDSKQNKTAYVLKTWDKNSNAWINFRYETFEYDVNNNQTSYILQFWNKTTNAWDNDTKNTRTYTNNLLAYLKNEKWLKSTAKWESDYIQIQTYNSNNLRYINTTAFWNKTTLVYDSTQQITSSYDVNNNLITNLTRTRTNNIQPWTNSTMLLKVYSNTKLTEQTVQSWNAGKASFENLQKIQYFYNGSDEQIQEDVLTNWDAVNTKFLDKYSTVYSCTSVTSGEQQVLLASTTIFPNPINSNFFFVNTFSKGTYALFDMTGKKLQLGLLTEGFNKIELPANLSNGIYVFQIGKRTLKMIVNK